MRYLKLYEEFIFHKSKDEDLPGNKQIVVFDDSEKYIEDGNTHGEMSHSIKHYGEFYPDKVNAILNDALNLIKSKSDIILNNAKTNEPIAKGDKAKSQINIGSVLNTFDLINDKILNKQELTTEEKEIQDKYLNKLNSEYNELIKEYLEKGVDIDGKSQEDIQKLIDSKSKIKFKGSYKGSTYEYVLDPTNTGMLAKSGDNVSTLFRIDKKGADLNKVGAYFSRGVEVENDGLKKILNITPKAESEPKAEKAPKVETAPKEAPKGEEAPKEPKAETSKA
jgi:hypothetical protein